MNKKWQTTGHITVSTRKNFKWETKIKRSEWKIKQVATDTRIRQALYFLISSTMYTTEVGIRPSILKRKLFLHLIHTWTTNFKDIQIGKNLKKVTSKYCIGNFFSLVFSEARKKSKKEDRCDSRIMTPALESNEEWQPAVDLVNIPPSMFRPCQAEFKQGADVVLAKHTLWHQTCKKDNDYVSLVAFTTPSIELHTVEIPVFPISSHLTASCSTLPTNLRKVPAKDSSHWSSKTSFLSLFLYSLFPSIWSHKISYRKCSTWWCQPFLISNRYPMLLKTFPSTFPK